MDLNNIAVIIPSLNPDEKFTGVVDGMIAAGFTRFVVVDDGSDKKHKGPFLNLKDNPMCSLLVHETNLGKGQALKDAFEFVFNKLPEIESVITIDGDGQHTPQDSLKLAKKLEENPNEVVFGCRDFDSKNVPFHNKFGNKTTSLVFRLFFGMKLSDTQTGLRGIPRKYLKEFAEDVEGTRFEYESNMLIYMSEKKIPFSQVPIETLYIEENKSSHFRPIRDSIRIYGPILKKATAFKFILTGVFCTIIDLLIYSFVFKAFDGMNNLWLHNFISNFTARVFSAILNYFMNLKLVFGSSTPAKRGLPKYGAVAIGKLVVSWVIQTPVFDALHITGFLCTIIKGIIDVALAFASYFIQKKWVYKDNGKSS